MTFEEWYGSLLPFERKCLTREEAFQAGAASRDAEIAEYKLERAIRQATEKSNARLIVERDQLRDESADLVAALKPFGAIDLVASRLPAEFAMLILRARAALAAAKTQGYSE